MIYTYQVIEEKIYRDGFAETVTYVRLTQFPEASVRVDNLCHLQTNARNLLVATLNYYVLQQKRLPEPVAVEDCDTPAVYFGIGEQAKMMLYNTIIDSGESLTHFLSRAAGHGIIGPRQFPNFSSSTSLTKLDLLMKLAGADFVLSTTPGKDWYFNALSEVCPINESVSNDEHSPSTEHPDEGV